MITNESKQACEQLNSWIAGYESILKRMNPGNFDWFLHTMLFYHTKNVIKRQMIRQKREERGEASEASDDESENEVDDLD